MTKSKYFSGARRLRAFGIAGLLVAVCGLGSAPALAEKNGDTKLDDSAKEVGNNFGQLLKGMGQEVGKVIGTEGKSDKDKADQDKKKDTKHSDDKSDKSKAEGSK